MAESSLGVSRKTAAGRPWPSKRRETVAFQGVLVQAGMASRRASAAGMSARDHVSGANRRRVAVPEEGVVGGGVSAGGLKDGRMDGTGTG
jgi:hypothetical protein